MWLLPYLGTSEKLPREASTSWERRRHENPDIRSRHTTAALTGSGPVTYVKTNQSRLYNVTIPCCVDKISNYQSTSWETDSRSASHEILRLLWNPTVHYRVHKSPPLDLSLCHTNTVHILTTSSFKIHFNIILSSTRRSSEWPLAFSFPTKSFHAFCIAPMPATCPTYLILLDLMILS
jgi:hypothetical protein